MTANANGAASALLDTASGIREAFARASKFDARTSGGGCMAVDALSDLLRTVRLTGATFFDVAALDPWAVASLQRDMILPKVLLGANHLIAYHVVTVGRCFATIEG